MPLRSYRVWLKFSVILMCQSSRVKGKVPPREQAIKIERFLHVKKQKGSKVPSTWMNRPEGLNISSGRTSLKSQKFPSYEQAVRLKSSLHADKPEGSKFHSPWASCEARKFHPLEQVSKVSSSKIPSPRTSQKAQKFPPFEQAVRLGSSLHVNKLWGSEVPSTWTSCKA